MINFEIKINSILPCLADINKIKYISLLECDISEILPYLNTIIDKAVYNRNNNTLVFKKDECTITLHSNKIAGSKVNDKVQAIQLNNWIKEKINYCCNNKNDIKPDFEKKNKLDVFDVYKLLPGLNCRNCGELTCLAFAVKLCDEIKTIMSCKMIFYSDYTDKKDVLSTLLKEAGYYVPEFIQKE